MKLQNILEGNIHNYYYYYSVCMCIYIVCACVFIFSMLTRFTSVILDSKENNMIIARVLFLTPMLCTLLYWIHKK